jgi:AraC-like DNA-binding protein
VIQFSEEFISSFLQHPEFADINKLLASSVNGLFFSQKSSKKIAGEIKLLPDKKGVDKITALLMVLQQLSARSSSKLASSFFSSVKGLENEKRINKVCQYVQKHAGEKISLQRAAGMIHLSDAAFCKFFKRATGKTFSDYVNDIRIGLACSLLTESDRTVNAIAYQCGFESLSYFNRVFLRKKRTRPKDFRNRVLQF